MASYFAWLDYSEDERRQMMDVVDAFRDPGTLDELGIGAVRDAFSDLFFPGISTIQTRARYFLFIPWTYLEMERKRVGPADIARRARDHEATLISALINSGDGNGIIGKEAGAALKRLPSMVYWAGLNMWGIRLLRGSQSDYHRSLKRFYEFTDRSHRNDDGEPIDGRLPCNWHPGIPPAPSEFPKKASFKLTYEEAVYLQERIRSRVPGTLLSFLVERGQLADRVDFPWQHHQFGLFPEHIREQLEHAWNFSEVIGGATMLYNLMLSELAGSDELIEDYTSLIAEWWNRLREREYVLLKWNRNRFWQIARSGGARVGTPTQSFIDTWITEALRSESPESLAGDRRLRSLVHEREKRLKGGLSRIDNVRARELWRGRSGIFVLDYRWGQAQVIISDILRGLEDNADA